jgi:hypothetical protein
MVVVTNRYIHDADIVSTALENLIRLAKANDEYRSGSFYKTGHLPLIMHDAPPQEQKS